MEKLSRLIGPIDANLMSSFPTQGFSARITPTYHSFIKETAVPQQPL